MLCNRISGWEERQSGYQALKNSPQEKASPLSRNTPEPRNTAGPTVSVGGGACAAAPDLQMSHFLLRYPWTPPDKVLLPDPRPEPAKGLSTS
jgi:hypothetical protein